VLEYRYTTDGNFLECLGVSLFFLPQSYSADSWKDVPVFGNTEAAKGYAFLKAFQMRTWSYGVALPVDDFA
jgi:hypothetical protein